MNQKTEFTPATRERIQKSLARMGIGSRRQIEEWIKLGVVSINGRTAQLGDHVTIGDKVICNHHKLVIQSPVAQTTRVLVYHKPEGEICTRHDTQNRPTIFDHLPKLANARWICVGRLDINTSGLLLITSNGELANRIMHPSYQIEREYAVRVLGQVTPDIIRQLQNGVMLEDGSAHFDHIIDAGGQGANHWYHVTLREGRNREVRRLWEAVGLKVSRLIRVRFGSILLPRKLKPGKFFELSAEDIDILATSAGLPKLSQQPPPLSRNNKRGKKPFNDKRKAAKGQSFSPTGKRDRHYSTRREQKRS